MAFSMARSTFSKATKPLIHRPPMNGDKPKSRTRIHDTPGIKYSLPDRRSTYC